MLLNRFLEIIEDTLPEKTALDNDRIGLQIQAGKNKITTLLIAYEMTGGVVEEAIRKKCDCIVSFHPLIYQPLYSIQENNRTGSLITRLIRNSIALIVIHTNFDAYVEGTSKILADKLGLRVEGFLIENENVEYTGIGVIASPEKPLKSEELLDRVHRICKSPVRFANGKYNKKLNKIAIVGGSGSSFVDEALACGADAYITADVGYHTFLRVSGKMMLIDPGHYEMEQFVPLGLAEVLKTKMRRGGLDSIYVSETYTNPVGYYPQTELYKKLQRDNLINYKTVE